MQIKTGAMAREANVGSRKSLPNEIRPHGATHLSPNDTETTRWNPRVHRQKQGENSFGQVKIGVIYLPLK